MPSSTLISQIKNACRRFADKTAVKFYRCGRPETRLTYKELDRDTSQLANFLLDMGVKKTDRVILLMEKDFKRITDIFGQEPVEREGMSETGMNFSNPLNGVKKPGSIGLPLPRVESRVVNPETCEDVPLGQTGEFWLKSPSITPGYWQKPGETQKTFKDGWFRTGDLGYVDEDGYYYLTDRIKNIIISLEKIFRPKKLNRLLIVWKRLLQHLLWVSRMTNGVKKSSPLLY